MNHRERLYVKVQPQDNSINGEASTITGDTPLVDVDAFLTQTYVVRVHGDRPVYETTEVNGVLNCVEELLLRGITQIHIDRTDDIDVIR